MISEPTRSYALVKAVRMYDACSSVEEMKIIDRYAELAQPLIWLYGIPCRPPYMDAKVRCRTRLIMESKSVAE